MKLFIFFISFAAAIFLNSCCGDCDNKYYNSMTLKSILTDDNGTIYLKYGQSFNDKVGCIKQNKDYSWQHIDISICNNLIPKENIEYISNKIIITDKNNSVVFEDSLPTISEVENSIGFSLPNNHFKYSPLEQPYHWDKKSHLLVVGTNKEQNQYDVYLYSNIYYFSVIKNDDSWIVNKIYESGSVDYAIGLDSNKLYPFAGLVFFNNEITQETPFRKYGSNNELLCDIPVPNNGNMPYENICLEKTDDEIVSKELFGEIVSSDLKQYTNNEDYYKYPSIYFFDKYNNMNIFYNNDDMKGEYTMYKIYSKDNPTTPLYEQKIPWK